VKNEAVTYTYFTLRYKQMSVVISVLLGPST